VLVSIELRVSAAKRHTYSGLNNGTDCFEVKDVEVVGDLNDYEHEIVTLHQMHRSYTFAEIDSFSAPAISCVIAWQIMMA